MDLDRNTLLLGGAAVTVCVAMLVHVLMGRKRSESEVIDRRLEAGDPARNKGGGLESLGKKPPPQLMDTLKSMAPRSAAPASDEEQSRLRAKLISAGIRGDTAPLIFLASKTAMGAIVTLITLLLTWRAHHPALNVFGLTAGLYFSQLFSNFGYSIGP